MPSREDAVCLTLRTKLQLKLLSIYRVAVRMLDEKGTDKIKSAIGDMYRLLDELTSILGEYESHGCEERLKDLGTER